MARAALCALAGAAWLALIPAAAMVDGDDLSYDGYFRVFAVPLLLLVLAWAAFRPVWPQDTRAHLGWWLTFAGLVLVFAGNTLEFWGALVTGNTNSYEGSQSGEAAWWGSNVGWSLVVLGFLALLVGGPTAAVAAARERLVPVWGAALLAFVGIGVMSANLFHDRSPVVTVPVFGIFGLAWIALGLAVRERATYPPNSRTTS